MSEPSPRQRILAECARRGHDAVIADCVRLLEGGDADDAFVRVLAGRTAGVGRDDTGRAQAEKLVDRLAGVPLAEIVCSPMLRCEQTVAPLAETSDSPPV